MSDIKGYRELSEIEKDAINSIKENEKNIFEVLEDSKHLDADPRMLSIAKTNFEQAFMWWVKSIAKPE